MALESRRSMQGRLLGWMVLADRAGAGSGSWAQQGASAVPRAAPDRCPPLRIAQPSLRDIR